MTVNILRHSERSEESILLKTIFDYCFTPCRSFRFAIRKTFIHFFGATSDWVRVAHTASYAKSVLDFLLEKQSLISQSLSFAMFFATSGLRSLRSHPPY